MKRLVAIAFAALIAGFGCGSSGDSDFPDDVPTQTNPVVSRITPVAGPVGSTITITGFGFSSIFPNNIVVIGDAAVSATGYSLVEPPTPGEIEAITAPVPVNAPAGLNSVFVVVYDNVSNADLTFTVTP